MNVQNYNITPKLTAMMGSSTKKWGALLLCCGALPGFHSQSAAAVCITPPAGLMNWWPAENTGEDIIGPNDGSLLNGTTYGPGKVGTAFRFDGTNDIILINAAAIAPPWTAEFWVNRSASPDDSAVLLSDTTAALKLEQYPNTKKVGVTRWGIQDYEFNYIMPTNVWTHLVFVGSNSSTTLYVNGARHSTLSVGISLPRTTMGRDITNRNFIKPLKGLLDETSLYNRALSAPEILALYQADSAGKCVPVNCTSNDDFACRQIITGSNIALAISNLAATREANEPLHGNISSSNSIWYSWTAPATGGVVIETISDFDFASPILAVYTGNTLATLTNVAFNFAPFSGSGSPLNKARGLFTAVSNQTYQIAVDGKPTGSYFADGNLNFTLNLSPPPANDLFANAAPIVGLFYEITNATFRGANREGGEPNHGANFAQTLWWTWTAPTNLNVSEIPVRLAADAVSHAPALGVYTGNNVATLTPVALAQTTNGMARTATFAALPGVTYRLAVAGLQNDDNATLPLVGDFRFRFNTRALALSINNVVSALNATQAVEFTATATVTNLGSASSGPLRVHVTAVPGISMRGFAVSAINELPVPQGDWSAGSLLPGQYTNLAISGIAPPHTEVQNGISSAEGYGVHAELQEWGGSNEWITVDEALVLYGDWPDLEGLPGPGGGVIRLDPGFIGLSAFNPLLSVVVLGPNTAIEGQPAVYSGRASYADSTQVNFTNTTWLATLPTITNGLFRPGVISGNTIVTLTAQFANSGFLYSATTNVTVFNLPSPLLQDPKRVGGNFTMRIHGVSNRVHVIEAATNLAPPQVWLPVVTNTIGASGLWNFTNATGVIPQRFFRAREVE